VVAKSNPQRAQQMVNHIEGVRRVIGEWEWAARSRQQVDQQQQRQQWRQWSKVQDSEYEDFASKEASPEERKAIEAEAWALMRAEYGATDEQIAQAWQSNPNLRSLGAQRLLFRAARESLARKSIASKQVRNNIPTVQRPGSGNVERMPAADAEIAALNRRLNKSGSPKDAAELLTAMRARVRRG
jgi:hypothetical protein